MGEPTGGSRYQVLTRLAKGGMAEIYLARASGIGRFEKHVVLKRLLPQFAADGEFVRMFLDEARLAATFEHRNLAQVYDIGCDEAGYFFAMEYLHGEDVRSLLQWGAKHGERVPLALALAILSEVASGLHYAHEQVGPGGEPLGLVHRDVSPSNVVITYAGGVKLVDFGIAKGASAHVVTREGTLKGKIAYMSPEQCRGERLDRRSDVFALGILAFELTTGRRLFRGDNEAAIIHRIVSVPAPRPSTKVPDYPPALEAIVMKALDRDRDRRFATARELLLAIDQFAEDQGLTRSEGELAQYMERVFGRRPEAWRELEPEEPTIDARSPGPAAAARPVTQDSFAAPARPRGRSRLRGLAAAIVLGGGMLAAGWYLGARSSRGAAAPAAASAPAGAPATPAAAVTTLAAPAPLASPEPPVDAAAADPVTPAAAGVAEATGVAEAASSPPVEPPVRHAEESRVKRPKPKRRKPRGTARTKRPSRGGEVEPSWSQDSPFLPSSK